MKTEELNDNDRQRIEQEGRKIASYVLGFPPEEILPDDSVLFGAVKGAEYEHKYQREQQEQLEADIKARNIFIENLEIYNQELISKLQSKCPDEELIKGYTNKIVEVAELKKEIRDTTDIYEKERAYLRELANKKTDESERYAKLVHSNNDKLRQLEAERTELIEQKETLAERVLLLDRTLKENHDHAQKSWEEDQQKISELRNKVIDECIEKLKDEPIRGYNFINVSDSIISLNSLKTK